MASAAPTMANERLAQWWQVRTRAERAALVLAGLIAALVIAWIFVWQPLTRDIARLERQVARQRAELAEARKQADDIASLARSAAAPASRDPRTDVEAGLVRQGLKSSAIAIERADDRHLRITFGAITFEALTSLLEDLQRDAKLRAAELTVIARVEPGQVRAELTLGR